MLCALFVSNNEQATKPSLMKLNPNKELQMKTLKILYPL